MQIEYNDSKLPDQLSEINSFNGQKKFNNKGKIK